MPTNIQKPLFRNGNGKCVLVDMKNKKNTQEKILAPKGDLWSRKTGLKRIKNDKKTHLS